MTALVKFGMSECQIEQASRRLGAEWYAGRMREKALNHAWREYQFQVGLATEIFNESCEKAHQEFIENQKP